ncbi:MAG: DMT family transporter [Chloroflexi bacterium]|nr:DMT family transporter [Chloroflexota bacterium]
MNLRVLALLVAILGGTAVGSQALLNGAVGRSRGIIEAIFVSVSITYVASVVLLAAKGVMTHSLGLPVRSVTMLIISGSFFFIAAATVLVAGDFPAVLLTPGLLGLVVLFAGTFATPILGVGLTVAALTAGQMGIGLIWDQIGILSLPAIPLTLSRVFGMLLIILGVVLVRGL